MNVDDMKFQRVFSKSMYKTLKLPLAEMTFDKDFIEDDRGDLYPVITKDKDCTEKILAHRYVVENGCVERMFTRFFPYATYELSFRELKGSCGFALCLGEQKVHLVYDAKKISLIDGEDIQTFYLDEPFSEGVLMVSCRPGAFDVYTSRKGRADFLCTLKTDTFRDSNEKKQLDQGYVCLFIKGSVGIDGVSSYMDCGISQADLRAVCYENGEVIYENGQVYFTASVRMQEGGFQGVFAWTPSTSNITFTGVLFFDCGDGFWRNYLASSLLYNRNTKEWYIWSSSFEHKHVLCYASFTGEPRFGVNVIDVTFMPCAGKEDVREFVGFKGDEDPDFYFDEEKKKWRMAICRLSPATKQYRYMFFESDTPFDGYTYVGQGYEGAETGGSFVKLGSEMAFICGNGFNKRANYRIYTKNGMKEAEFDFDDGGFRGWGSVIPVAMGSRKRYFWLTFDRHNGSAYPWSYGNIYCFEAIGDKKA